MFNRIIRTGYVSLVSFLDLIFLILVMCRVEIITGLIKY